MPSGSHAVGQLERTVRYRYFGTGHVANISVKDEYRGVGDPKKRGHYRRKGDTTDF
jgi:hypothetical protein